MGFSPTKSEVYDFLQDPAHTHGVLAYLDASLNPDSAFIGFSCTKDLEIIFSTSDTSRKFNSIKANPVVAFNITDEEKRYTAQLKGTVSMITKDDFIRYEDTHYSKIGEEFRKFKDAPDRYFFLITTTYLKFTDCSVFPWVITEIINTDKV